jgi:hypothetical protein
MLRLYHIRRRSSTLNIPTWLHNLSQMTGDANLRFAGLVFI